MNVGVCIKQRLRDGALAQDSKAGLSVRGDNETYLG